MVMMDPGEPAGRQACGSVGARYELGEYDGEEVERQLALFITFVLDGGATHLLTGTCYSDLQWDFCTRNGLSIEGDPKGDRGGAASPSYRSYM